jgi:hypothetical protein
MVPPIAFQVEIYPVDREEEERRSMRRVPSNTHHHKSCTHATKRRGRRREEDRAPHVVCVTYRVVEYCHRDAHTENNLEVASDRESQGRSLLNEQQTEDICTRTNTTTTKKKRQFVCANGEKKSGMQQHVSSSTHGSHTSCFFFTPRTPTQNTHTHTHTHNHTEEEHVLRRKANEPLNTNHHTEFGGEVAYHCENATPSLKYAKGNYTQKKGENVVHI